MTRPVRSSPVRLLAAPLVLAALLVGCGGDDPAAAPPAGGTATTARPAPVEPLVEVEVLGGPDWLAADGDRLYLKRDDGGVDEVDAATGATTEIAALPDGCQGVGAGEGTLWACQGSGVVQIDPATGDVLAEPRVVKTASQGTLAVATGRVWVLVGDGSALVGIDVATGESGPETALGVRGSDLVAVDGVVYVASGPDDAVIRVDVVGDGSGSVAWVAADVAAATLAIGDDGVLWAGGTRLHRLDGATGEVLVSVDGGPGADGALAADGRDVWVRSAAAGLRHVDAAGAELDAIDLGVTSGGDVLVTPDAVFASAYDDAALFRLTA